MRTRVFVCLLILIGNKAFSQTSLSETTGLWTINSDWVGGTAPPTNAPNLQNIFIDGYITRNGNIASSSNFGMQVNANDTLVITEDLTISNGNLTLQSGAVLIIYGDVTASSSFNINLNGGSSIFAGSETNITNITTNGSGHLYVYDPTPSITGNINGSNGLEDETDLSTNDPDLHDFASNNDPLPVELLEFKAKSDVGKMNLTWSTASELNNDFFNIEHSMDGFEYQVIGSIDGNGTVNHRSDYEFAHDVPNSGANYYRLRQVDFDGAFEYSPTILAFFELQESRFETYPNPIRQGVILTLDNRFQNTALQLIIIDQSGKEVFRQGHYTEENSLHVDLPWDLANGTYQLLLANQMFKVHSRIVLKR